MSDLPQVILDELARCPRADCHVSSAMGEFGACLAGPTYLECAACGQIWGLDYSGGYFSHWDKSGESHYTNATAKLNSKWPRGEFQCESGGGVFVMRFVDAPRDNKR